MKRDKILYFIFTGLLSAMMLMSASMYLFNHEMVAGVFTLLGFPTFIIYPLAAAKILGIATLWIRPTKWLVEWAYAGFFFDFLLAMGAHLVVGDGEWAPALAALLLVIGSRFFYQRTFA